MDEFSDKMELSNEFKAALYSALKKHGIKISSGYRNPTEEEDKYDKVDVFYKIEGDWVPAQLRVFNAEWDLPGFPIRNSQLVHGSELDKLKAGELDDMLFAYATAVVQPSIYGKYKFLTIKATWGIDLKANVDQIVGTRTFEDENSMIFIKDPSSTMYLRNWK